MSPTTTTRTGRQIELGLRQNLAQFVLLVAVNALVGGMLGQERTVVPLLGKEVFGLTGYTAGLMFILVFGIAKAATNYFAGTLSDRFGRKPVLVAGWTIAVPVPLLLIWAPSWGWVVAANVLLGVSQGLTWSTTVVMKIDLVGPARRGLAMGLNEAAGYVAVAVTALATGYLAQAYGLRPEPFFLGIAFAALGLGLSTLVVKETREHVWLEAANHVARADGKHDHLHAGLTNGEVVTQTSFKEPALSSASQAGLVNNLNDGLAWLFPILFAAAGLSVDKIGILAALYPAVWGLGQLFTGALSDRVGRKWMIAAGMWLQALALGIIAAVEVFGLWALAAVLLGAGTALVYPTLLASIGDVAHPAWRARSVGVYRLWRDGGFAAGALLAGIVADALASAAEVGLTTRSAHLQILREAGLVTTRREGKRIYYSLAGDDVAGLWHHLRRVAQRHRPHAERARRAYLGPEDTTAMDTDELLRRLEAGDTVVLDVRPEPEYAGGHLPGALHIPLEELEQRLAELPRDREIVAYCRGQYCVLAHNAVRLLISHGVTARRAVDGVLEWRVAGVPVETGAA